MTRSRYLGSLVGLAVGDALGTTLEFTEPGSFDPIDDMVGGGPFHLEPGQWTDDTSMALCLAESLVKCGGGLAHDQRAAHELGAFVGHARVDRLLGRSVHSPTYARPGRGVEAR